MAKTRDKPRYPQHVRHTIELLRSPAMRVLSRAGHKILMCVESELCKHAGKNNGKLPVTYEAFEEFGLHRHAIGPGLREVEALGLLLVTERGRAGNANWRRPNLMMLTYLPSGANNKTPASDQWRNIATKEEAEQIAQKARNSKPAGYNHNRRKKRFPSDGKRQTPVTKTVTGTRPHQ